MPLRPQLFFVHIPKCAGTSVLKSISRIGSRRIVVLSESPRSKEQAYGDLHRLLKSRRQKIEEIDIVIGHDVFHGLHAGSQRPPIYLTILRDPVERYISHYRYFIDCSQDRNSPIHEFAKAKIQADGRILSLEECVEKMYWHNLMTNYLASANHPDLTKGRWKIDNQREQFRLAIDFINKMSFVGSVKNLNKDMEVICNFLGLRYKLGTVNQSKSNIPDYLSTELIAKIRLLNSLDQQVYEHALN